MNDTLFDLLTGSYIDETPIHAVAEQERLVKSVHSHLSRLLNSRQGCLKHLPDYGLPDVAEMYQGLPYSMPDLMQAIKKTIERYEPRLKHVTVNHAPIDDQDCVVHLQIKGQVGNGDQLKFDTYFLSGGKASLAMA